MVHAVFVYGSLMFPPVYEGVTGTRPEFSDVTLPGFNRYAVKDSEGSAYPAMIPAVGGLVDGKLIVNVTDDELAALDRFEEVSSGLYSRRRVTVEGPSGPIEAEAYIAGESLRGKLSGDWDVETFARLKLPDYLVRVVGQFRQEELSRAELRG